MTALQPTRPTPVEGLGAREQWGAHLAVQFLHGHQIQGLERVPSRRDKVQAHVDPRVVVVEERAADLQFLLQIVFKLRVDVVNYGPVTTDSPIT